MISLKINGQDHQVDVEADTPLLWVLRDNLGMTGTKYSCGKGICGTCTVYVDDQPTRACTLPVSQVAGKSVTTIEGLNDKIARAVQDAWIAEEVPQCGYCQSGQIMTAAALLRDNATPGDEDIDRAMSANLCRCGTYQRVRKAIHRAAKALEV